jgi:hypothetical protein
MPDGSLNAKPKPPNNAKRRPVWAALAFHGAARFAGLGFISNGPLGFDSPSLHHRLHQDAGKRLDVASRDKSRKEHIVMTMTTNTPNVDAELLVKLNEAVAVANEAEKTVSTAQAELLSRSKAVGVLLLEAKKLHPAVKEFEAFLKRVDGLKLSRAYDLLRLAGGRITDEQLKKDARERQQKSRASKKNLPKPTPALPQPKPISVTDPHVTETAEAKLRKAQASANARSAKEASARCLAEFIFACRQYLPKMTEADKQKAFQLVLELTSKNAEAA